MKSKHFQLISHAEEGFDASDGGFQGLEGFTLHTHAHTTLFERTAPL